MKIAGSTQRNTKRMKTNLKTMSVCGLAAMALVAVGPASFRAGAQPVYAPIDLSSNNNTAAAAPVTNDAAANVVVTTNAPAADTTAAAAAAPAAAQATTTAP